MLSVTFLIFVFFDYFGTMITKVKDPTVHVISHYQYKFHAPLKKYFAKKTQKITL
jgi:hypothetical protein